MPQTFNAKFHVYLNNELGHPLTSVITESFTTTFLHNSSSIIVVFY